MSKKIGHAGLELIMSFEGCRLTAYKPVQTEKYYTIGYGHYGADVKKGMKISMGQAEAYLIADCQKFANYVDNKAYVPIALNDNQRDALISFTYNCGAGNLKKLCAGRTSAQIAEKLLAYNKAGGKVLHGLTRRREAERALFLKTEVVPVQQDCYTDGKNYVTTAALNIRITPAGALKRWDKLTASGKKHSDNNQGYAVLRKGTTVTCKEIRQIASTVWMRIPSGWIAAITKNNKNIV